MKKMNLISLVAVFFYTVSVHAQEPVNEVTSNLNTSKTSAGPARLQAVVGFSAFQLKFQGQNAEATNDVVERTTGFTAGGLMEFGRGRVSGQTGLMFLQTGYQASYRSDVPNATDSAKIVLNYLAIPAIAKINLQNDPNQTFFLKGGVMPMVFVGGKMRMRYGNNGPSIDEKIKTSEIREGDVAASVGGGYTFALTERTNGIIDVSYNRGLINMAKGDNNGIRIYNEGFLVSVGTSLGL